MSDAQESRAILKDMLRRMLSNRQGEGDMMARWRQLRDELGLLAAPLPEARGGLGGGFADSALIAEELGCWLMPVPFVAASVIAIGLFDALGREDLSDQVVSGDILPVPALMEDGRVMRVRPTATMLREEDGVLRLRGRKELVEDVDMASHLLVPAYADRSGEPLLLLLPAALPGMGWSRYRLLDGREAATVVFDDITIAPDAVIGRGEADWQRFEAVLDRAMVATCAEALGLMRAMLGQTVDYVKQRRQFGKTIASFQVVQHRLADMLIEVEQAASVTAMAVQALPDPIAASTAKARTSQALRFVAQNAVQLHGGIGTTEELALSRYFKRAMLLETQYGSAEQHLARVERLREAERSLIG